MFIFSANYSEDVYKDGSRRSGHKTTMDEPPITYFTQQTHLCTKYIAINRKTIEVLSCLFFNTSYNSVMNNYE